MKEFDVHFIIKFSDFFGLIDAKNKEEAQKIAIGYINNPAGLDTVKNSILENLKSKDFEVEITDILEVGKDI